MVGHFGIGFALGVVSGVPLGVVGLAIIDAACRHSLRRAIGIGIGGGLGDLLFSALGVFGVGRLVAASEVLPPLMFLFGGLILLGFGAINLWRLSARPLPARPAGAAKPKTRYPSVLVGMVTVALNPAAVLTWTVVVAGFTAGATSAQGAALALGIGIGSVAWFLVLAHLSVRGLRAGAQVMTWIIRIACFLLIGYGVYSVGRGLSHWI